MAMPSRFDRVQRGFWFRGEGGVVQERCWSKERGPKWSEASPPTVCVHTLQMPARCSVKCPHEHFGEILPNQNLSEVPNLFDTSE